MCVKKVIRNSVIILLAVIAAFIINKVIKTQPLENQVSYQAKRSPNVVHWAGLTLWSENTFAKLKKLNRFYFLIHGLCYAEMTYEKNERDLDTNLKRYLEHENKCARKWRSGLKDLDKNEALIIIPWHGHENGPASQFNSFAASVLGDRCFILDSPDSFNPSFWSNKDDAFYEAISSELKSALIYQKDQWNDEELHTALHSLACCRQLDVLLRERGFYYDKSKVTSEGWGASFDGCVTKYTLNIRRILGLSNVIEINFNMTVPDALFLLDTVFRESVILKNGLRLFLFQSEDQAIGLYTMTSQSLENRAVFIKLKLNQNQLTVKSKQGIRLWPNPEIYHLPQSAIGHYEPEQKLVTYENNKLILPVSAGFVYRLAKAPTYIFANSEMTYHDFKEILINAEIVNEQVAP